STAQYRSLESQLSGAGVAPIGPEGRFENRTRPLHPPLRRTVPGVDAGQVRTHRDEGGGCVVDPRPLGPHAAAPCRFTDLPSLIEPVSGRVRIAERAAP